LGVDTGFYKTGWLYNPATPTPRTLAKDIRRLEKEDVKDFDAIVHMAELSNDPTGELAPKMTYDINHHGSVRLAQLAKDAGVRRFIYMSSCSVYGVGGEDDVTEESPVNPQTAYAICKTLVERDVQPMADDNFSPVFFRNATAFGASPRQRFDLVVNNLCGLAWTTGVIKMQSDGTPWRPLVHGLDIARAICCALDAPTESIHNQILNIGDSSQNYRVREIANIIGQVFPGCEISFGTVGADNRSYRVSFAKVARCLPEFRCEWNVEKGVKQFRALFERIALSREIFDHPGFTRLKQLEYLIKTKQIDDDFYWRNGI
jgi:nucleoside-diphosphate-sugar epimerase